IAESGDGVAGADKVGAEAGEDRDRGPDVAGKVKSIGGKRGRAGAAGNGAQLARAPEIDGDGSQEDGGRDGKVRDRDGVVKDAGDGFPDDPDAGSYHQKNFAEGGEVFELGVAVGVFLVSGLIADE